MTLNPKMTTKKNKKFTSLIEMLDDVAQKHPEKSIRIFDHEGKQEIHSYKELAEASKRAASGWEKWVEYGDRILFSLPNGFDFLIAFFGALRIGALPIPIAPPTEHQDASDRAEFLSRLADRFQAKSALFALHTFDAEKPPELGVLESTLDISDLLTDVDREAYTPNENEIAYIQMTSGTTGTRRGVQLKHLAILQNIDAISEKISIRNTDITCSWLPLYNTLGLLGGVAFSIYHALNQILLSPARFTKQPERWLETMSKFKVTLTVAPSHAYFYASRRTPVAIAEKIDLSHLRIALIGGDAIRQSHIDAFIKTFKTSSLKHNIFSTVYGLSEATLGVTLSTTQKIKPLFISRTHLENTSEVVIRDIQTPIDSRLSFVSSGEPLSGVEIMITDEKGIKLPTMKLGRITIKSKMLMDKYVLKETDHTQKSGDWLMTDDLGFLYQKRLYFVARTNERIEMPDGRQLFAHELEFSLDRIDGIRLGCTMIFHPIRSEFQLVVVAEIEPGADAQEIKIAIRETLYQHYRFRPQVIQLLSPYSIPRSPNGKVRRHLVQTFYQKNMLERKEREYEFEGVRKFSQRAKHTIIKWLRKRKD